MQGDASARSPTADLGQESIASTPRPKTNEFWQLQQPRERATKGLKKMQTLIAYVENRPGVLNRVSSLARRLAINIDSLTVGPTDNEEIARMTIVAHTDERGAHRLEASLEKLVDVLLAENVSERSLLERDLALIKVSADQKSRPHLMELIKVFRARVIDVAPESLILEVSGTVDKIDGLLEVLRPFGVLEMARSGRISMTRGADLLRPPAPSTETQATA
jgi:acetolactate synthase-1/3 small subunit